MWFLLLGLLGIVLKYFEIGRVGLWSWWIVLTPFALAVAWWTFADASGFTRRNLMKKEKLRKRQRVDQRRADLGMDAHRTRRAPKDKN